MSTYKLINLVFIVVKIVKLCEVQGFHLVYTNVTMGGPFGHNYSCGLSTATIEYSCLSVCLSVCVHDNSKNNGSIHLKLEHIVVYENSSDKFDIGDCLIKVKVNV